MEKIEGLLSKMVDRGVTFGSDEQDSPDKVQTSVKGKSGGDPTKVKGKSTVKSVVHVPRPGRSNSPGEGRSASLVPRPLPRPLHKPQPRHQPKPKPRLSPRSKYHKSQSYYTESEDEFYMDSATEHELPPKKLVLSKTRRSLPRERGREPHPIYSSGEESDRHRRSSHRRHKPHRSSAAGE